MEWHQLLQNPKAISSLYNNVPGLDGVELFSLCLSREGPRAELSIDLSNYPDYPSPRWNPRYNTVQLKLSFGGIKDFEGAGWQYSMTVNIVIDKIENQQLKVTIFDAEKSVRISFVCLFFRIDRIIPYLSIIV
ncbi:MAG: immunity 50 family protein [Acidobacteriota bacterium]|nr:immunity 50 family protein [Acidobacteriota bacterium]